MTPRRSKQGWTHASESGTCPSTSPLVPLRSAQPDKGNADDPNHGIGRLDLVGIGPDDRLVTVAMRYLGPDATRVGTGDTPLRALLEVAHRTDEEEGVA